MTTPAAREEAVFGGAGGAAAGKGRQRAFWVPGRDLLLDLAGGDKGVCFLLINCRGETGEEQPDEKQKDSRGYTAKKSQSNHN